MGNIEKLVLLLPPDDLKSGVLVCKSWNSVGEWPVFWNWVRPLQVTQQNLTILPKIVSADRFRSMKKLRMKAVSKELLQAIENHPDLKILIVNGGDLSAIDPNLLARVLTKMEEVIFECDWCSFPILTIPQLGAVFLYSFFDESKLKKLKIAGHDLSCVPIEILARGVCNVEEADMESTKLTCDQCEAILRLVKNGSTLKKLNLSDNDLEYVKSDLLAKAVCNLEEVNLTRTYLNTAQCEAIFIALQDDCKLKKLNLKGNRLYFVNPEHMGKVVAKMEETELTFNLLSNGHYQAIFSFAQNGSNLKKLTLSSNADLSSVNPEHIAKTVCSIEEVDLGCAKLKNQQYKAIFTALQDEQGSKLKKLVIDGSMWSSEDRASLDLMIAGLEDVNQNVADMEDVGQILADLEGVDQILAGLEEVDQNVADLEDLDQILAGLEEADQNVADLEDVDQNVAGLEYVDQIVDRIIAGQEDMAQIVADLKDVNF